jgi:20S proteasome alpha/beta subunit
MTIILTVHGKDFVILGSDSRGTDQLEDGSRVESNVVQKVWPAGEYIRVLLCGEGDYAYNLYDIFQARYGTSHVDVRDAANHLAEVAREDARQLKGVPGAFEYGSGIGFIVTGLNFEREQVRPMSFSMSSDDGYKLHLTQLGYCIDGKSPIPRYILVKHYDRQKIEDDLSRLAAHAICEVGSVDSDVGGNVRIAIIERAGYRDYTDKAVNIMLSEPIEKQPEPQQPPPPEEKPDTPIGTPPRRSLPDRPASARPQKGHAPARPRKAHTRQPN